MSLKLNSYFYLTIFKEIIKYRDYSLDKNILWYNIIKQSIIAEKVLSTVYCDHFGIRKVATVYVITITWVLTAAVSIII